MTRGLATARPSVGTSEAACLCSCQSSCVAWQGAPLPQGGVMTVCSSSFLQHDTRHRSRVVHRARAWRDGDLPHFLGYAAAPALGDCAADLQHWQGYKCLHIVTMQLWLRSLFRGLDQIVHTGFLDYLSSRAAHEGLCHWQYPCEWVCVSAWLASQASHVS